MTGTDLILRELGFARDDVQAVELAVKEVKSDTSNVRERVGVLEVQVAGLLARREPPEPKKPILGGHAVTISSGALAALISAATAFFAKGHQ